MISVCPLYHFVCVCVCAVCEAGFIQFGRVNGFQPSTSKLDSRIVGIVCCVGRYRICNELNYTISRQMSGHEVNLQVFFFSGNWHVT